MSSFKKGLKANLPSSSNQADILYTTDEKRLYIGNGAGQPLSRIETHVAINGDGATDDSGIINAAISSLSTSGGGTLILPPGKTVALASSILIKNNVILDLNNCKFKWTGGANGKMISNDITGSLVSRAGVLNGRFDISSANLTGVFDLHSVEHCIFKNHHVDNSNNTNVTFLYIAADVQTYPAGQGWKRNSISNLFEGFTVDGKVGKGVVLEGKAESGVFSAVTNNTFAGPFTIYSSNIGYEFLINCDSNVFTGWHTCTITNNNGKCIVFNNTATPSVEMDVWGLYFEYFSCQVWDGVTNPSGVIFNYCADIFFGQLTFDKFNNWGENKVIDNYGQSYEYGLVLGNPVNEFSTYKKGNIKLVGSASSITFNDGSSMNTAVSGGNGNVTGPASSTDNSVVRFDGTTGKLIQGSGVSVDDNNYLSAAKLIGNGAVTGYSGVVNVLGSADTYGLNISTNLANMQNYARMINLGGIFKTGPGSVTNTAYGMCFNPTVGDNGSGTAYNLTNVNGLYNRIDLASSFNNATIANMNGIAIGNPVKNGTGTITNNIGLMIEDMTTGTGSNWSMKIGSAPSYHKGGLRVGDTALPTEKLEVAGNIKLASAGNGIIFSDGTKLTTATAGSYYASTSAELTALIPIVTSAGGGRIILGAGTFICPSQVVGWDFSGTSNVTIEGAGRGLTILKWPDHFFTGPKVNFWQATDYIIRMGSNSTIKNLTIDGNKANQSYGTTNEGCNGLYIGGNNNVIVDNVEIKNTTYLGMLISNGGQVYTSANGTGFITVKGCYIHDTYNAVTPQFPGGFDLSQHIYSAGIILNGSIGNHGANSRLAEITIEDTEIRNCGWDGINGWGVDKVRLINNRFINNGLNCDVVFGFGACGVYLNDGEDYLVTGNIATNNTESGISISKYHDTGIKNAIITNNYIKNNNLGMEIIGLINSRVADNILIDNWMGLGYYDNIDGALSINASVDTVIENNTIIDTRTGTSRQHYAIFDGTTYPGYYAANTNLIVRDNIIKNFRQTFYNIDYSSTNQIDGVSTTVSNITSIDGGTF